MRRELMLVKKRIVSLPFSSASISHEKVTNENETETFGDEDSTKRSHQTFMNLTRVYSRDFKNWSIQCNQLMQQLRSKPNQKLWLDPRLPFPSNPDFLPPAPLSDNAREQIYQAFKEKKTPRLLAAEYRLSEIRAAAIIRLKHAQYESDKEKKLEPVSADYIKAMERALLPVDQMEKDPLFTNQVQVLTAPLFMSVPEGDSLTGDEAATLLNMKLPKVRIFEQQDKENSGVENSNVEISEETNSTGYEILGKDAYEEKSRYQFRLVDLNPKVEPQERKIWIREPDGTLRTATPQEREEEGHRVWGPLGTSKVKRSRKEIVIE